MLDNQSINDLIVQQITTVVNQQVADIVTSRDWLAGVERELIGHVQDRITARFANISNIPDLVATVETSVSRLIDQGALPGIGEYVDQDKLTRIIDQNLQALAQRMIDNIVLDPVWVAKIETMVNQNFATKFNERLSMIDVNNLIAKNIDDGIDRWQARLKKNFATNGIKDTANTTQLTVMDDAVVVENETITNRLNVVKDATIQELVVKDLVVKGSVNTDNSSWNELSEVAAGKVETRLTDQWRQDFVREIIKLASTQGIEFKDVIIDGEKIVVDGTLGKQVTQSYLTTVGTLSSLTVDGTTNINKTLSVHRNRVGINTEAPEMALSIWDEEITIVGGKLSKNQAYLGTARVQNLAIGVNRTAHIEIDTEGLTTVKKLRVGQHRMVFEKQVPGWSGTRGDIAFNSDPKAGQPFAWQCLGGFQWQPLKVT